MENKQNIVRELEELSVSLETTKGIFYILKDYINGIPTVKAEINPLDMWDILRQSENYYDLAQQIDGNLENIIDKMDALIKEV